MKKSLFRATGIALVSFLTSIGNMAISQVYTQEQKIEEIVSVGAFYGNKVAVNGNYAIASAPYEANGVAYIYKKNTSGNWEIQDTLFDPIGGPGDSYGSEVAITKYYALVGASYHNASSYSGSVYVYKRDTVNEVWEFHQLLKANDEAQYDAFGTSIAINQQYIVVGAPYEAEDELGGNTLTSAGSAYIFELNGGVWTQMQKIVATDRTAESSFGYSVAINGIEIVVGAPTNTVSSLANAGSIYHFKKNGVGVWEELNKLTAQDKETGDQFGISVAISDSIIVAGAYHESHDANGTNFINFSGSAYVFKQINPINWVQQQKLVANDRRDLGLYGRSVEISPNNTIAVSDFRGGPDSTGGVYVYQYQELPGWVEMQYVLPSDGLKDDSFGEDIAITDSTLFVGSSHHAQGDVDPSASFGATYFYAVPNASSPCSELFFSEYVEDGANKALEIYNPTNATIDLSSYSIKRYTNGSSVVSGTFVLGNVIQPYSSYVITAGASGTTLLALADTTSAVLAFNGNDAMALFNGSTLVDLIGVIGQDPGTSWSGNGVFTEDQVLRRKPTIELGVTANPATFDPSVEWNAFPLNDYSDLGQHTNSCAGCLVYRDTIKDSICNGDTYTFRGDTYSASGTYSDTLSNNGCDSIYTVVLEVINYVTPDVTIVGDRSTVCYDSVLTVETIHVEGGANPSFVWYLNNTIYGGNGETQTFPFDSLASTNQIWVEFTSSAFCVTANPKNSDTITISKSSVSAHTLSRNLDTVFATGNGGAVFQWYQDNDGNPIGTDTNYVVVDTNVAACYFVEILDSSASCVYTSANFCIGICPEVLDTIYEAVCLGDSILFGGKYYSQAGQFNDTIVAGASTGCDSIVTMDLTLSNNCGGGSCSDLFFSEYIEDASNKALEIYNPTNTTIDLSGYSIHRYTNGSASISGTFALGGTIEPYGTYVIAATTSSVALLAYADTTSGILSFNGNDAVSLANGVNRIDLIGVIGQDPGTSWSGSGVSTEDQVIRRKGTIDEGVYVNPASFDPSVEWEGFSLSDYSNLHKHASTCFTCVTSKDSITEIVCLGDSIYFGGEYISQDGFYTDTLIGASPQGCDSIITLEVIINNNCGPAGCEELFISEYLEGSSFNKAIEIYNPTADSIDVSAYSIALYQNGSTSASTIALSGYIQAYDVYTIVHTGAINAFKNVADLITPLSYNGNDAIVLFKGTDTIDVFGKIGEDPGVTGWMGVTTDYTLVRKTFVDIGITANPLAFDPNEEWEIYSIDDSTYLGSHSSICAPACQEYRDTTNVTICAGNDFVDFHGDIYTEAGIYTYTVAGPCDSVFVLVLDTFNVTQVTITRNLDTLFIASTVSVVEWIKNDTSLVDNLNYLVIDTNIVACYAVYVEDTTTGCTYITSDFCLGCQEYRDTTDVTICPGESYEFYGDLYFEPGTYTHTVTEICDSVFVLILDTFDITLPTIVRHGDSLILENVDVVFNWVKNDSNLTDALDYLIIDTNETACYSALVGDVLTGCSYYTEEFCLGCVTEYDTLTVILCDGDSTLFNGAYRSATGYYYDTVVLSSGCDRITTLDLTVYPLLTTTIYDSICVGDSILFEGNYYHTPGSYVEFYVSAGGCDSSITLELSEKSGATPSVTITSDVTTICSNGTVNFSCAITDGGASPVIEWTLDNNILSMDSLYTSAPFDLYDGAVVSCIVTRYDGCGIQSATSNDITISVNTGGYNYIEDTICEGEVYTIGGQSYDSAGFYTVYIPSQNGCDSTVDLDLTVLPAVTVIANADIDTISVGGTVNFNPNGSNAATYEWDFGDNNTSALTSVSHTYNSAGTFTVILKGDLPNTCSGYDTLYIVVTDGVGVFELANNASVNIYPNPATEQITIALEGKEIMDKLEIYDAKGNLVYTKAYQNKVSSTVVNVSSFERGIYYIHLVGENLNAHVKISKLN